MMSHPRVCEGELVARTRAREFNLIDLTRRRG